MENYFTKLNSIDVSSKTEKKNGLTYLSWAWAWAEVKKLHPDATYTIYENKDGWNYHTDGKTCWVKTGATVNGIEHIEYLPVMDYRNASIPKEKVTSFDVNKAIQRSLTKAIARHGIGLYIYAGEDLPEEVTSDTPKEEKPHAEQNKAVKPKESLEQLMMSPVVHEVDEPSICNRCLRPIVGVMGKNGVAVSASEVEQSGIERFGKKLCADCQRKERASK